MKKKFILRLLIVVAVGGGLGIIKFRQFHRHHSRQRHRIGTVFTLLVVPSIYILIAKDHSAEIVNSPGKLAPTLN